MQRGLLEQPYGVRIAAQAPRAMSGNFGALVAGFLLLATAELGLWAGARLWLPVLIAMLLVAAMAWISHVARRLLVDRTHAVRRGAGFCACCGYDLRATRDRCPECGTTRVPTP
jgi:hypothetical protein